MYETGVRLKSGQTLKSSQVLEDPVRVRIMKTIADDMSHDHTVDDLKVELDVPVEQVIDSIAHLEEAGLVEPHQGTGQDGHPNGSSYSLTENGRILVIDIRAEQMWMKRLGDLLNGR
jgi:predicted transcriptional regulator